MNILSVCGMEPIEQDFALNIGGKTYKTALNPNEIYAIKDGALTLAAKIPFSCPKGVTE